MSQLVIGDLAVEVVRKTVKHVRLSVHPPDGRVRVSAPPNVSEDDIRALVNSRLVWIEQHQRRFADRQRQVVRAYESGDSVYFLGRCYVLNVEYKIGLPRVAVRDNSILHMTVAPGSDATYRKLVMQAWYRIQLKALVPPLIERWSAVLGVQVEAWGIKIMKTRWGSCNTRARRIWLNLDLARKPEACLEYVLVHELVHLLERGHNDVFYAHLSRVLPDWQARRDELNHAPSGHPAWEC